MSWRSRPEAWTLALVLAAALPCHAAAQGWTEVQVFGVGLDARPRIAAGGLGAAWRDRGRTRIGATLAAGATGDGRYAARAEFAWHFLLDPTRRSGLGVYGGGGVAVSVLERSNARPWALLVVGLETSPGARRGFFVEGGVGGGARVAMGLRFRSPRAPARRG